MPPRRRKTSAEVLETRAATAGKRQAASVDLDDDAFRKGLRSAVKGIELKTARDLLRLGLIVQNKGRDLCPVDTGRLRASIQAVEGEDERGPFVDVGTNVEYGPAVEYGTDRSAAQPFMRPALLLAPREWARLAKGA